MLKDVRETIRVAPLMKCLRIQAWCGTLYSYYPHGLNCVNRQGLILEYYVKGNQKWIHMYEVLVPLDVACHVG